MWILVLIHPELRRRQGAGKVFFISIEQKLQQEKG